MNGLPFAGYSVNVAIVPWPKLLSANLFLLPAVFLTLFLPRTTISFQNSTPSKMGLLPAPLPPTAPRRGRPLSAPSTLPKKLRFITQPFDRATRESRSASPSPSMSRVNLLFTSFSQPKDCLLTRSPGYLGLSIGADTVIAANANSALSSARVGTVGGMSFFLLPPFFPERSFANHVDNAAPSANRQTTRTPVDKGYSEDVHEFVEVEDDEEAAALGVDQTAEPI